MKYKEFVAWCNERAADGRWGFSEAAICINIITEMQKTPFFKRKKKWAEMADEIKTMIVDPTNAKIEEYLLAQSSKVMSKG